MKQIICLKEIIFFWNSPLKLFRPVDFNTTVHLSHIHNIDYTQVQKYGLARNNIIFQLIVNSKNNILR